MTASDTKAGRPYGGRLPDERRAERRRRLIDAGLELFATQGYQDTSVAHICRAAKVAPAKFYEEFTDREAMLVQLCHEILEHERQQVIIAITGAGPDIEAMTRAGVSAYCHSLLDDPRRARVLCVEFAGASLTAEAVWRDESAQFSRLTIEGFRMLTVGQAQPLLDDGQLALLARALLGAVHEAIRQWLFQDDPLPIDALVDTLMTMYVAIGTHLVTPAASPS